MERDVNMNVKEVAEYAHLSRQTIYNLVNTKKIPFSRISEKKVVFHKNEIDDWLNNKEKKKNKTYSQKRKKELQKTHIARHFIKTAQTSKLIYVYILIPVLFIVIGWAGSFYYFKSKVFSFNPNNSSSESIDLHSLIKDGKLGRIEISNPSLDSDKVQIYLDQISDIEIQGEANSSPVKPLLIQTLKSPSEGYALKSKTIDVVKPFTDDPKIREALIYVVKNEIDPVIRMKALTVLARVAKVEEVKDMLLDRLINDDNIGIRFKSIEIIEKIVDDEIVAHFKQLIKEEQNDVIKAKVETIYKKYSQHKL